MGGARAARGAVLTVSSLAALGSLIASACEAASARLSWSASEIVTAVETLPEPPVIFLWLDGVPSDANRIGFHIDYSRFPDDALGYSLVRSGDHPGAARVLDVAPARRVWGDWETSLILETPPPDPLELIAIGVHPPETNRPATFVLSFLAYLEDGAVHYVDVSGAFAFVQGGSGQRPRGFVHTATPASVEAASTVDMTLAGSHLSAVTRVALSTAQVGELEGALLSQSDEELRVRFSVPMSVRGACSLRLEPEAHHSDGIEVLPPGAPVWPVGTTVWKGTDDAVALNLFTESRPFPLHTHAPGPALYEVTGNGAGLRSIPRFPEGTDHRLEAHEMVGGRRLVKNYDQLYLVAPDGETVEWHKRVQPGSISTSSDGTFVAVAGGHGGHGIVSSSGVAVVGVDGAERLLDVGLVRAARIRGNDEVISVVVDDVLNGGRNPCELSLVCSSVDGNVLWREVAASYAKLLALEVRSTGIAVCYEDWSENRGHDTGEWSGRVFKVVDVFASDGSRLYTYRFPEGTRDVLVRADSEPPILVHASRGSVDGAKCVQVEMVDVGSGSTIWSRAVECHAADIKSSLLDLAFEPLTGQVAVLTSVKNVGLRTAGVVLIDGLGAEVWRAQLPGPIRTIGFVDDGRFLHLGPPGELVVAR